jgi:hypothetical protein
VHLTTSEQTPNKNTTKLLQHQTSQEVTDSRIEQKQTVSRHNHNTSLHKKCAIGVHQNNITPESLHPDLAQIVTVWPNLPEYIKTTIKMLVEIASDKSIRFARKKGEPKNILRMAKSRRNSSRRGNKQLTRPLIS